jgi:hypothetical protein
MAGRSRKPPWQDGLPEAAHDDETAEPMQAERGPIREGLD